jgi:SAM-dependent methyltransferase
MTNASDFWDALAPFHAELEDTYFDLASVRRLLPQIRSPVLVVGGGQGLIVADLRKKGFECDGVDLSAEMVRHAKLRRGIELMHVDARAMPFTAESYETVIFATGVVDFTGHDDEVRLLLKEGKRVARHSGHIFVAFYKLSAAQETFLTNVGLLSNAELAFRRSLELYLLGPVQTLNWVAASAHLSRFRAALALLRMSALCTMRERRMTLQTRRIINRMPDPRALIEVAPEKQPYRNEREIDKMFQRLGMLIEKLSVFKSCFIVRI